MSQVRSRRSRWSGRAASGVAAAALSVMLLAGCSETPEEMVVSAKAFIEKQDLDAASIQLKNALQQNGNLAEARFLLGRINLRQGNVAGGVKELQRALELGHPRDVVAVELAPALVAAGEVDKLFAEFGDPRVSEPKARAAVLASLGDAHMTRREIDKARASYLEAIAAVPDEPWSRIGLARTTAVKGDLVAAEGEVREALKRTPDAAEAHALLADLLLAQGRVPEGVESLREVVRLQPKSVNGHFALVSQLLRSGDMAAADAALENMRSVAAAHPFTRYLVALKQFRENRLNEARDTVMQVLKDAPQFLPADLLAGTVLVRLNDHALGRTHLERVLQAAPRHLGARQTLILSHLATGEAEARARAPAAAASGHRAESPPARAGGPGLSRER